MGVVERHFLIPINHYICNIFETFFTKLSQRRLHEEQSVHIIEESVTKILLTYFKVNILRPRSTLSCNAVYIYFYTKYAARAAILSFGFLGLPRPPGLLPLPRPLPLRAPPPLCIGWRMAACLSSTRSWKIGSQKTQPVCCVSPSASGERALWKSTITKEASQDSQLSGETCTLWACSKKCTTTVHLLQAMRHLGPELGSKTSTPVSHSTH